MGKQRFLCFDVMRVFAIIMVVFCHSTTGIILQYTQPGTAEYGTSVFLNTFTRFAIPIFVMLSGALLLNEDYKLEPKAFYKKTLPKFAILTVGWVLFYGVFYAVLIPYINGTPINAGAFVDYIIKFKGVDTPHLWYMFMVIGLYLAIPVLRLFVKRENKNYILGIIIVSIIFNDAVHSLGIFTDGADFVVKDFFGKFHLEALTGYLCYAIMGWYLNTFELSKKKRIFVYILGFGSIFATAVGSLFSRKFFDYFVLGDSLPSIFYGIAVFVLFKTIFNNRTTKSVFVSQVSKLSFGIYIIHMLFLDSVVKVFLPYTKFASMMENLISFRQIYPFIYIVSLFAVTFLLSFVLVFAVSKIKGLRKIFYL